MLTPTADDTGTTADAEEARKRITGARGILLDWDGCAAVGNHPHDEALTFIARHKAKLAIVSNNSTLMPEDISDALAKAGVEFPSARVFLAGMEALSYTANIPGVRALVLGNTRMKALARRMGVQLVHDDADVVVLLRDTRFTYSKLERAVQSLARGARLIVSNPDMTHPGSRGHLVPETGALLAAITACVDVPPENVQVIGKPAGFLFERACAALRIRPEAALMIGDNPDTDVQGAGKLRMPSVLMAPGSRLRFSEILGDSASEGRVARIGASRRAAFQLGARRSRSA